MSIYFLSGRTSVTKVYDEGLSHCGGCSETNCMRCMPSLPVSFHRASSRVLLFEQLSLMSEEKRKEEGSSCILDA